MPQGDERKPKDKLQVYIAPSATQTYTENAEAPLTWPDALRHLTQAQADAPVVVDLDVQWRITRGSRAPITNKKKLSVSRARWRAKPARDALRTDHTRGGRMVDGQQPDLQVLR